MNEFFFLVFPSKFIGNFFKGLHHDCFLAIVVVNDYRGVMVFVVRGYGMKERLFESYLNCAVVWLERDGRNHAFVGDVAFKMADYVKTVNFHVV